MTQEEMLSQMNSMLQSLQQVNASQAETIIRLTRQNESLQNRLNELTAQVAWLNRQLFGHKSEKLPSLDSSQPDLFGDFLPDNAAELEKAREAAVQTITKETVESKKRERNNRKHPIKYTIKKGCISFQVKQPSMVVSPSFFIPFFPFVWQHL